MDNGYSLSDLRAATGDGNGFGGNGAWWMVILFLICFMGGSFGAHWDLEQTRVYMESRGVDCEVWKWAAVMNMMYSDYCKAARKNSVDRPEFYADLAAAFLEDKDAPEDKAGRYYHSIAAVQE